MDISRRFPKQKEIVAVYAIIVLLIYGWTILRFSYNLPGWLYFLSLAEIASIFAYSMVTTLLESLLLLAIVVALGFVLPSKWFGNAFVASGAALSILTLGLMMVIASQFRTRDDYPADLIRWSPVILAAIAGAAYFLGNEPRVRRTLEWFSERAVVFLYLSLPISIISLIVIIFRLIL